jgi:hypothetical protein
MNVDEAMRRFRDPSEWKLRFDAPGYVAPPTPARAPLRFAAVAALVLAGITVLGAVGVGLSNGFTPAPPIAPPVPSPTATPPVEQTVTPDDGRVAASQYRTSAYFDSESSTARGTDDSVPWVVLHASNTDSSLAIVYVAGGSSCGDHRGVEVIETQASVTITAVNRPLTDEEASACRQDPSVEGGSFSLKKPLGKRALLHGALSAPWTSADLPIDTDPAKDRAEPTIPDPRVPAYDGPATCENLLSQSTRQEFARKGWTYAGQSYSDKIWEEGTGHHLYSAFIDNGGLVCAYGTETLAMVAYGYGPIATDREDYQRSLQKRAGSELSRAGGFDVYSVPDSDATGVVAFGDEVWAFSQDLGAGYNVLDDVLQNVP